MGIIGVVAALTLPNLNSSTGDKEKVAKVKKIYSNLEDAYGRATAVYGPFDEWFKNDTTDELKNKRFGERMTEFMKVSKSCGTGDGCFSSNPLLDVDGSTVDANYLTELKSRKAQMYILADGTALAFFNYVFNEIKVDIDGPNKGRNQIGNDIFDFTIRFEDYGGQKALQLTPSANPDYWTGNFTIGYMYRYSTAWVIKNENLDYLKCSDLNWETKTSCK